MKKYFIFIFIMVSGVLVQQVDAKPPKSTKTEKADGKIKAGNKTGTTTITIDLGVIKYTRTTLICDGDLSRQCYEKKGEDVCGASSQYAGCATYEYEDGTGFGGVQVGDETVIDHPDGSSQTIVDVIFDSYFTF